MDKRNPALRGAKQLTPPGAKTAALRLVRRYGVATQGLRGLPDFLILGGKRCGTTTLYWHLVQHPCVSPLFPRAKRIKGVHFFDWNFERGVPWYRSHFPTGVSRAILRGRHGSDPIAGEASSSYLFHPRAPERAQELVPGAKLIVLLRNPVERAWSHHRARVRRGLEPLPFQEALAAEPDRLAGEQDRMEADPGYRSHPLEQQAYASLGAYLDPLRAWMGRFPRERVLVLLAEDLARDPDGTYARLLGFLDLPTWRPAAFRRLNADPEQQEMPAEARAELVLRFGPQNARLAEYLGMELGWDGS